MYYIRIFKNWGLIITMLVIFIILLFVSDNDIISNNITLIYFNINIPWDIIISITPLVVIVVSLLLYHNRNLRIKILEYCLLIPCILLFNRHVLRSHNFLLIYYVLICSVILLFLAFISFREIRLKWKKHLLFFLPSIFIVCFITYFSEDFIIRNFTLDLSNTKFTEVNKYDKYIKLHNKRLEYANLKETDFSNTDLQNCRFDNAKMDSAVFNNTNLKYCKFNNANMKEVKFSNIKSFNHADFSDANLTNADFSYSIKVDTITFTNADLSNTEFDSCNLYHCKGLTISALRRSSGLDRNIIFPEYLINALTDSLKNCSDEKKYIYKEILERGK